VYTFQDYIVLYGILLIRLCLRQIHLLRWRRLLYSRLLCFSTWDIVFAIEDSLLFIQY